MRQHPVRARERVRKWCGYTLLVTYCMCASVQPQDHQVRAHRQKLQCENTRALTDGDWFRDVDTEMYWWQPRSCFPKTYWSASAKRVLHQLKPIFLETACVYGSAIRSLFQEGESRADGEQLNLCNFTAGGKANIEYLMRYISLKPSKVLVIGLHHQEIATNMHKTAIHQIISALRTSGYLGSIVVLLDCSFNSKETKLDDMRMRVTSFLHWLQANNVQTLNLCKLSRSDNCHEIEPGCTPKLEVAAQLILNMIDNTYEVLREPGSCAVVSTAGYQLAFANGPVIDDMDYVIRVGLGPFAGFEANVGSRTDLRIIRHSTFDGKRGSIEIDPNDNLYIIHDRFHKVRWSSGLYPERQKLISRENPHWEVRRQSHVSKTKFARCLSNRRDLTTGIWALLVLSELTLCRELFMFGFLGHLHPNTPYHYFTTGYSRENVSVHEHYASRALTKSGHDFINEHICLLKSASRVELERDIIMLHTRGPLGESSERYLENRRGYNRWWNQIPGVG